MLSKSLLVKIGVCCAIIMTSIMQSALPVYAEEQTTEQNIVDIPDPLLKQYLNEYLKQEITADITQEQMDSIKEVRLAGLEITDLTGLEYAHNLRIVNIASTKVRDFHLIKELTNLERLSIAGYDVTSDCIPDLNHLQKLEFIDLSHSRLDNRILTKISKAPKLKTVNLSYNAAITEFMPLKNMPALEDLNIQFCGVHDFRGIEEFTKLTSFAAFGQTVGAVERLRSTIKPSQLTYDEEKETMYVPFSLMTNRLINFDGYKPNFTKSTKKNYTDFVMNNKRIDGSRLLITDEGFTVSDVSKTDFDNLKTMDYYALFDVNAGTYNEPKQFLNGGFYAISGATYQHYFTIEDFIAITSDKEIIYIATEPKSETEFLADIHATTDVGSKITTDFAEKVDMNKPGEYDVTLQAEDGKGLKATPVQVKVTIIAKTVITADQKITYEMNTTKSAVDFFKDIQAKTNDGTEVTSNFQEVVDFSKSGEYVVTLNAKNDKQEAKPMKVTVIIEKESSEVEPVVPPSQKPKPVLKPEPELTLIEDPEKTPTPQKETAATEISITASKPETKAKVLPKTGDSLPIPSVVLGCFVLGLSALVIRKR
ncbi:LPXTG cell wall anchor domain-containing protein [Listeria monocytogenes]|uniref:LPXTG cell wall anchor domain-containing protein n=1 Tax=Listeria monocytogenes TaxID=1639 RepID=A0A5Y9DHG8_LISMN|nr:LapB repeat-containing protein [Listeria monocytogenes]EAD0693183.1 LPXTG cell wall anchor domain-containing protein [Listeria monocytogenes]EAH4075315.1 LPXTG cell wall anchor domain-containing protein [Listeria monocytogenes]ECQ6721707.1 LPXTG cell wall anchor domain-containing protein [Listeria monocytogenes]TYU36423.1 LPXTG cell wall anchor domain-containing protein [Listeria monocytogenes]TYU53720.1 LPXTG cell wall anchor domain-containing protein [Listeria monocytogenes]